jgi:hypothetical protein
VGQIVNLRRVAYPPPQSYSPPQRRQTRNAAQDKRELSRFARAIVGRGMQVKA